jgi:hypothetical protein
VKYPSHVELQGADRAQLEAWHKGLPDPQTPDQRRIMAAIQRKLGIPTPNDDEAKRKIRKAEDDFQQGLGLEGIDITDVQDRGESVNPALSDLQGHGHQPPVHEVQDYSGPAEAPDSNYDFGGSDSCDSGCSVD